MLATSIPATHWITCTLPLLAVKAIVEVHWHFSPYDAVGRDGNAHIGLVGDILPTKEAVRREKRSSMNGCWSRLKPLRRRKYGVRRKQRVFMKVDPQSQAEQRSFGTS